MTASLPSPGRIRAVETWTCRFELPRPIVLEHVVIREREYTVVRVTTEEGITGLAYSLTRGAPIAETLDRLVAPLLLGEDALDIPRHAERVGRALSLIGIDGFPLRALSLVDICLWDIKAKASGVPVWELLGGVRDDVPVLLVDCYPEEGSTVALLVEQLQARAAQGYRAFKLHCPVDRRLMTGLLDAARASLDADVELVVDLAMSCSAVDEAVALAHDWEPFQLGWIEDPFRGEEAELLGEVHRAAVVPLGAGDEVASARAIERLITLPAVDVVRLDATCHGGITGFRRLSELARVNGLRVSAHTYPEVHQHCAFATVELDHVEAFAPSSAYDCSEEFVVDECRLRPMNGRLVAPRDAGVGLELDWASVEGHAVRTTRTAAELSAVT